MTILLSIKPEFANAIFDGKKRYEFRRIIFKQKVTRVIIYVTAPVGMILGEFSVESVLHEDVERLWTQTQDHAGVREDFFFDYFTDKKKGYAIKIGDVTRYNTPLPLKETYGVSAPQSFVYIV